MKRPLIDLGLARAARRHGVALILTLGVLSLLLITCMAFAFSARLDRTAAKVRSEQTRAGLLGDAAMHRAIGFMAREFTGRPYPSNMFLVPTGATGWEATPVLFSWQPESPYVGIEDQWVPYVSGAATNTDIDADGAGDWGGDYGLDDALHVVLGDADYTPATLVGTGGLVSRLSFIPVLVPGTLTATGTVTDSSIVARYAYVIRDHTGQLDPGWLVDLSATPDDETVSHTGDGDGGDITFISLDDALPTALANALVGRPAAFSWLSYQHIFHALPDAVANNVDLIRTCFPYTRADRQQYWNNDGTDTVLLDRMDLTTVMPGITPGELNTEALYKAFMGVYDDGTGTDAGNTGYDVSTMSALSPWLRNLSPATALDATTARRIAATMALNIVDAADTDSDDTNGSIRYPGGAVIAADGTITVLTPADLTSKLGAATPEAYVPPGTPAPEAVVWGTENGVGLSELCLRLRYRAVDHNDIPLPPGNDKDDLEVEVAALAEVFDPFTAGATHNVRVVVNYSLQVSGDADGALPHSKPNPAPASGTIDITAGAFDATTTANHGTLIHTGNANSDWTVSSNQHFFPEAVDVATNQWNVVGLTIESVVVYCQVGGSGNWRVMQQHPGYHDPGVSYFFQWSDPLGTMHTATNSFNQALYATIGCQDVMFSNRAAEESDFGSFWQTNPAMAWNSTYGSFSAGLTTSDNSATIGTTTNANGLTLLDYTTNDYSDITAPANAAFTRLIEVGRLHSPHTQGRSVRLWTYDAAGTAAAAYTAGTSATDVDAGILDMFNIGGGPARGTVNINGRNAAPLEALMGGVLSDTTRDQDFVTALRDRTGIEPFMCRGDIHQVFARALASADYSGPADDDVAETDLGQFIEFTQVRDQYYTVVTAVQILHDLGAETATTYAHADFDNAVLWRNDGTNDHYALVYGQRQELIVVYRDGWTQRLSVLRRDVLE